MFEHCVFVAVIQQLSDEPVPPELSKVSDVSSPPPPLTLITHGLMKSKSNSQPIRSLVGNYQSHLFLGYAN